MPEEVDPNPDAVDVELNPKENFGFSSLLEPIDDRLNTLLGCSLATAGVPAEDWLPVSFTPNNGLLAEVFNENPKENGLSPQGTAAGLPNNVPVAEVSVLDDAAS